MFAAGMAPLLKWGTWLGGAAPAVLLMWKWQTGQMGVVPVEALLHQTGRFALLFLIATLALGFIQFLIHWRALFAIRRPLGVWTFLYASGHAAVWFWLDQGGFWDIAWAEMTTMAHVQLGLTAVLLLLPLALTSIDQAPRLLGFALWKRLHLLVWPAAALAISHVWVVSRFQNPGLIGLTLVIMLLMLSRLYVAFTARKRAAL